MRQLLHASVVLMVFTILQPKENHHGDTPCPWCWKIPTARGTSLAPAEFQHRSAYQPSTACHSYAYNSYFSLVSDHGHGLCYAVPCRLSATIKYKTTPLCFSKLSPLIKALITPRSLSSCVWPHVLSAHLWISFLSAEHSAGASVSARSLLLQSHCLLIVPWITASSWKTSLRWASFICVICNYHELKRLGQLKCSRCKGTVHATGALINEGEV